MIRTILRYTGALWLLQIEAWALAAITFQWRPVATAVSLAYLYLAWRLARAQAQELPDRSGRRLLGTLAVVVLWLLPALAGSINVGLELTGVRQYDGISDLFDFAMQSWQTPLMPLLDLLPRGFWGDWVPYYWALSASGPLAGLAYLIAAVWPVRAPLTAAPSHPIDEVAAARAPGPAPAAARASGEWAPARRWQDAARKANGKRRPR